jgi:antibiotic biosynthesis monooxygenase (ABM) superfamily enzyme
MNGEEPARKQLPAWLVGLLIAVVVFVVVLVVANLLGFGDDPAIGAASAPRFG